MKDLVGKHAPEFQLRDKIGSLFSLEDVDTSYVVLHFYPKDYSPGSISEAKEYTALAREFEKRDAVIVGITGDDVRTNWAFSQKYKLTQTILSDPDGEVAKKYGALWEKEVSGQKTSGIQRKTVVLNEERRIIKVWSEAAPNSHPREVLDYLLKHKEPAHGARLEDREDFVPRVHSKKRALASRVRSNATAAKVKVANW